MAEVRIPAGARPGVTLIPVDFDPFAEPRESLPLTDEQAEVWSAAQMGPSASCAFNQCLTVAVRGALSVDALEKALHRLVERHEALRARFNAYGEGQTVVAEVRPSLARMDVSSLSGEDRAREVAAIVLREGEEPFDLVNGPLFRAQLLQTGADEHMLVFTAHHLVLDGWSSGILLRDLGALYSAERNGVPATLPAAASYRDYLRQMASPEEKARQRAAEDYWAGRFADAVPVVELPLDRARPTVMSYRGGQENASLSAEFQGELRKLGARHGCTLYVTLFAAFQVLVSRLAGQTDVVVGIPLAGQAQIENGNLVGHCVHTLPMRARVDHERPFLEHMKAVRGLVLAAHENHSTTFGNLVRRLALARDPSRTPLVSLLFNVDKLGATPEFAGLGVEVGYPDKGFVNFDINLNIMETSAGLSLECSYNADLFERSTVRRWLGYYRMLLENLVAGGHRAASEALSELPLLTDEDLAVFRGWNSTAAEYPEACVHELIAAQAGRTPERVALGFAGRTLSYGELEHAAERLAQRLRAQGVGRGARVGVFMRRSPEMVVGLLGVLKAGGAYVPLDPDFPAERLSFMLEDSGAAVLLTDGVGEDELPSRALPVMRVQEDEHGAAVGSRLSGPTAVSTPVPDDLAYVIYTSGSTGRPKGVAVTHRALVNLLVSMGREPGLGERDVLLSVTTLSFDIAALEIYLPLLKGARIALASREDALDGKRLIDLLESSRATVMQATPATWRLMIEAGWQGTAGLKVLCGGEALPRSLADELLRRSDEVWNLYGPTETTVWSSVWRVEAGAGSVSIGRPIANTQMWVLDGRRQPMPVGVPGELYIGGVGLARGYWNRPDLTEERFVADPFSEAVGGRLYRTGDIARSRGDGRLECLGRIDHQVKVRGFRVELGEIEASLTEHPLIHNAAVIVREDDGVGQRLVAYVVGELEPARAATLLQEHLRKRVPYYMVPSEFVVLEALPLTPNGKIDRKALPSPPPPGPNVVAPPRNPSEEAVAAVWRQVLARTEVGIHDNFFDLGGHSMLAARLLSRLHDVMGVDVPLRTLFQQPTVAGLADVIQALKWVDESGRSTATGKREEVEL